MISKMITRSEEQIDKFTKFFDETTFDDRLYSFSKANYHASFSSLEALKIVNQIVSAYTTLKITKKDQCLLHIYGLFQGLFVGIDSLYRLSLGITKQKWNININNNEYLREIKYIRNDVVGHPTHRTYQANVIGYCDLDVAKTNKDKLVYNVYQIEENKEEKLSHDVDIMKILMNYYAEEYRLMEDIFYQLKKETTLDNNNFFHLSKLAIQIKEGYLSGQLTERLIDEFKNVFVVHYNTKSNNYNRLIWRANFLIDLQKIECKNNMQKEVIDVLIKDQINRLIKIANDLDAKRFKETNLELPIPIEFPAIIIRFGLFIQNNAFLKPCLEYIHDPKYPNFSFNLKQIKNTCKDKKLLELLDWFTQLLDNNAFVFTLGKLLKDSLKEIKYLKIK